MLEITTVSQSALSHPPESCDCQVCLSQREFNILSNEKSYWKAQFERSKKKNEELIKENEILKAKLALREKQPFGKKGEKRNKNGSEKGDKKGKRGQRKGTKGHGMRSHKDLPVVEKE